jgi:hypothetical protein
MREAYDCGRQSYREGKVVPPQNYTTIEKMQWDAGYADEHKRNPDPQYAPFLYDLANKLRHVPPSYGIDEGTIDELEKIEQWLLKAHK